MEYRPKLCADIVMGTLGLNKQPGNKQKSQPKKKKQTCRADKKRGRKPQKSATGPCCKKQKKQNRRRVVNNDKEANRNDSQSMMNTCGNCGFGYGEDDDPLIDDTWCRCALCSRWCHESCGTARSDKFVCIKCEDF